MKKYVLGFAFNLDMQNVLLIRKNSKDENQQWQNGKLNGLGGKLLTEERVYSMGEYRVNKSEFVELETPEAAMVREFKEESGIETTQNQWRLFAALRSPYFMVNVYTTVIDLSGFKEFTGDSGELVKLYNMWDWIGTTSESDIEELVDPNVLTMMLHASDPNLQLLVINYHK